MQNNSVLAFPIENDGECDESLGKQTGLFKKLRMMTSIDPTQKQIMLSQLKDAGIGNKKEADSSLVQNEDHAKKQEDVIKEPSNILSGDPLEIQMFDISSMNKDYIEGEFQGKKEGYQYGTLDGKTGYIKDPKTKVSNKIVEVDSILDDIEFNTSPNEKK